MQPKRKKAKGRGNFLIFNVFILLFLTQNVQSTIAGNLIKLVNEKQNKIILIPENVNIGYTHEKSFIKNGVLDEIHKDYIVVNGNRIQLEDLRAIGQRAKGTFFKAFISAFIGGTFLGAAVINESVSGEGKIVGIIGTFFFYGLAASMEGENRVYPLNKNWKLEVVNCGS